MANHEHAKEVDRKWRKANRERIREQARKQQRKWYADAANREYANEKQHKQRYRKRLAYAAYRRTGLIPDDLPYDIKLSLAYQTMKRRHPEFFELFEKENNDHD